jgi:hypothetical protein
MNPYSGFRDKAHEESARLLVNVKGNIQNSLLARGLPINHFYAFMKDQGIKSVRLRRLRKYSPKGNLNEEIRQTEQLVVISLAAVYMGISLEDTLTKILTVEQHKMRQ